MEKRLSKVETAVEMLLKSNEALMEFQKSVDESVRKIADTFVEYQKFQVEAELYRQTDIANVTRIEAKLDALVEGYNDQMHTLHGRIRRQKERAVQSDNNFELFKQSVVINRKHKASEDAREAKGSDKWYGLAAGGILAAAGAFFSKFFGG